MRKTFSCDGDRESVREKVRGELTRVCVYERERGKEEEKSQRQQIVTLCRN